MSDDSYRYAFDPKTFQHNRPCRVVEAVHRWWYRRWYAMLPDFYQDFYPFSRALSLTLQYAKHQIESAQAMDNHASASLRNVVDLEQTITQLRLALASAQSGWNEDRVDRFMGTWFRKHDLPTSEAAKGGE